MLPLLLLPPLLPCAAAEKPTAVGETLQLSVAVAAPRAQVYAALTTPAKLERWLCDRAEIQARVGSRFRCAWNDKAETVEGSVTLLLKNSLVELDWPLPAAEAGARARKSRVQFRLAMMSGGTRVYLLHSGLRDAKEAEALEADWAGRLEALQKSFSHRDTGAQRK